MTTDPSVGRQGSAAKWGWRYWGTRYAPEKQQEIEVVTLGYVGLDRPYGPKNLGPKCGVASLLGQVADPAEREWLTRIIEDPNVDPTAASHAVSTAYRYQASISSEVVQWHRHRGMDCPCRRV